MSKKHYVAIAALLRKLRTETDNDTIDIVASTLADYFEENPRFNRDQFMRATCHG